MTASWSKWVRSSRYLLDFSTPMLTRRIAVRTRHSLEVLHDYLDTPSKGDNSLVPGVVVDYMIT